MYSKIIYDNIHKYIEVDDIALQIIDTPEFQRLRRIKQGGISHFVYPTFVNNRFEHSIGVYHLAKKMINNIKNNQPELNISDKLVLLVSISGLCHDLGHMMFSHLFDHYIKITYPDYKNEHEERSVMLLNHIVKKYKIPLDDNELMVISDLILANISNYDNWIDEYKCGEFIFEIIANKKNNIDVDKFDYINRDCNAVGLNIDGNFSRLLKQARVINNEICYPNQSRDDIFQMFFTRYQLHKIVYTHKTVISIELLILDIISLLDKEINLLEYLSDFNKMIKLTDDIIFASNNENIIKIINDIYSRNIPKLIYEKISLNKYIESNHDHEKYKIVKNKIGYVNHNENPFYNVSYYNTKTFKIEKHNKYSLLTNNSHQEYIYRVYE
jgi:HD superfamily phosphohydrolase